MLLSWKQKSAERKQQDVDVREAFIIWDILNSKYMMMEKLQIWEDFAHDKDLVAALRIIKKPVLKNIHILEKMMERFSIDSPDRNRSATNTPINPKVVTDEYIAMDTFFHMQEHVENLLKALRNTVTNDLVRKTIKKMAIRTINEADTFVVYLKAKGWFSQPPAYRNLPADIKEDISLCAVSNLWDHLTYRYDNRKTTEIFYKAVHDVDFKLVLHLGSKQLNSQIAALEKELKRYGIPMPKRPGKFTQTFSDLQILDDDHIYRVLLASIQGAAILHAQSFKECASTDRVRGIFKQLLIEEINMLDKFMKIGKLKGWLNPAPTYGP
ncbi:DUF3231 family protein [Dethiobacter alkaliphilus]|uniref:DUF3231 family protein n=1 Tax=Dethiobacter alkaliphilus AHT 1 TaxID=555088 RepID=C0GDG6_DETAL|nr:DUF3231 family protein [Dethiobacter alkaliphilus]EEG78687.1 hypothetical protein DealDRAFT_0617 [Dethiobacter alkaliphilus AHT 1]